MPHPANAEVLSERPQIALVLQGGGALGAYHLGAYQALQEAGLEPDWFAGISIGAINACLLAGNEPGQRLPALESFWHDISRPGGLAAWLQGPWRRAANTWSFMEALSLGQPGFWLPRLPSPALLPQTAPEQASWCDTSPLYDTLRRLAHFELINAPGAPRLSLGATQVRTGELVFFDNRHEPLGPEHVVASGALPPAFPPTRVGDELYWDGGCVSNTPLDALYQDPPGGHLLVFMLDLWDAHGQPPTTMDAVAWRQKQIQYASRSTQHIRQAADAHNHRWALRQLAEQGVDLSAVSAALDLRSDAGATQFDIVHLIYQPGPDQIANSDAEFSRTSIAERRAAGLADMQAALAQLPLLRPRLHRAAAPRLGTRVHTWRSGAAAS